MKFKSAVDWWYYLVIVLVALVLLFSLLPQLQSGLLSFPYFVLLVLVSLGLPLWLLFATDYTVEAEWLRIRSGPFRWNIELSEIESARPTRSPLSSPALSLNRIELVYQGGRRILVSPGDAQGFLSAIGHAG